MTNKTIKFIVILSLIMISSFVQSATGTLSSDSPCTLPQGASTCDVTMTVQKQNTPISCIWKTQPTLGLVSCFAADNWTKVWTDTNVNGHTMQLKAHDTYPGQDSNWPNSAQAIFNAAPLLDQEIVIANPTVVPTGTLSSDSPCTLPQGASTCDVTMTVQKQNTPISCIWKTQPTFGLVSCFAADNWTKVWTDTNVNGHTMQLKAHDTYPGQDSNWPSSAQSIFNAAPLLDDEIVIANNTNPPQLFMGQTVQGIQPGQQDVDENAYSINTAGDTLALTGNTWKAISYTYTVTPNTVLQFEFRSIGQEAEINGVGFPSSLASLPIKSRSWQVHGTQNWAINQLNYNGSGWITYTINIGQTFTGNVNYMAFFGDDDGAQVNQNVEYRNPQLYEGTTSGISQGGSVMAWYDHQWTPAQDPKDTGIIMPFGIIKNYHQAGVRGIVKLQLQAMYLEGQRRIGVNFFHGRSTQWNGHGTYINTRAKTNSSGAVYYIEPQYLRNLALYLSDINSEGFVEVLFNTHTAGCNDPQFWINWYLSCQKDIEYTFNGSELIVGADAAYDPNDPEPRWQQTPLWRENWRVTAELRNTLESSGVNYLMDLQNEATPVDNMETIHPCVNSNILQCLDQYPAEHSLLQERTETMLKKRWQKFVNNFTKAKTVGFSIISSSLYGAEHRSATMANIYGNDFPNYLKLHMYVSSPSIMTSVFNHFKTVSGKPIIIGETFYNDADVASALKTARAQTGVNIKYVIQWPIARINSVGLEGYKHLPPLSFSNYQSEGF